MGSLIDTHCHLNLEPLVSSWQLQWQKASEVLSHAVVVGTDYESSQKAIELASQEPNICASVGLHPLSIVEGQLQEHMKQISELAQDNHVVGIGETGIDLYHAEHPSLQLQEESFALHMRLAIETHKTLIIHSRAATSVMLKTLSKYWDQTLNQRVVFHCCEPDPILLEFAITHHCFIGVDGDVTYDKKKQDFIPHVPLQMLVLETDAPYLQPQPIREKTRFPNTPANLQYIAEYVSSIYKKDNDEIARQTTENAKILYSLKIT